MKINLLHRFLCLLTILTVSLFDAVPVMAATDYVAAAFDISDLSNAAALPGAVTSSERTSNIDGLVDKILDFCLENTNTASVQEMIDSAFVPGQSSSDWYMFALSHLEDDFDFSSYMRSAEDFVNSTEIKNTVTEQRLALALLASGSKDNFISDTANTTLGTQGIMSLVFGLHLLNNSASENTALRNQAVNELLALHLSDGGWALTGNVSDIDVTAMVLQALAPCVSRSDIDTDTDSAPINIQSVLSAIDEAVAFLALHQRDSGDYVSFGVSNPESTAQVIIALASLGIDCLADERFIKNGCTLLDGLTLYMLDDGSFCHTYGGQYNSTSTVQALCALVSLRCFDAGRSPFFMFSSPPDSAASDAPDTDTAPGTVSGELSDFPPASSAPDTTPDTAPAPAAPSLRHSYKFTACLITLFAAVLFSLILWLSRKRRPGNFVAVVAVAAAAILLIALTDFKSADDYYGSIDHGDYSPAGTVTLSISCDTVAALSAEEYIPSDGVILAPTSFEIYDGYTVFDVLTDAAKQYKISIDHSGSTPVSQNLVYVSGINYIYEFDFGDLSGWLYRVNGTIPSEGCGSFTLSDGDTVEWIYSLEMGRDIPTAAPDSPVSPAAPALSGNVAAGGVQ